MKTNRKPGPLRPPIPKADKPEAKGRDRRRIFSGIAGDGALLEELERISEHQWSRGDLRRAIQSGLVQVAGKPAGLDGKGRKGTVLRLDLRQGVHGGMGAPPAVRATPVRSHLDIVDLTGAFLVILKPAGLLSQELPGSRRDHVLAAARAELARLGQVPGQPLRLVHRLDEGTSGLMVLAVGETQARKLKTQFEQGRARRLYLCWVEGLPAVMEGRVDAAIGRPAPGLLRRADLPGGKPAVTRFRVVHREGPRALVLCQLLTGRTHQVRLHMAHLGCPVVGDTLYGRGREGDALLLHSAGLALLDPKGKLRTWVRLPPPAWPAVPPGRAKEIADLLASLLTARSH